MCMAETTVERRASSDSSAARTDPFDLSGNEFGAKGADGAPEEEAHPL